MIGIIGYGRFGKLVASYLKDFELIIYDKNIKEFADNLDLACSQKYLILCVPISELEKVFNTIKISKDTILIDTCSVKEYPFKLMKKYFPDNQILGTHPLFGPDSTKEGIKGKKVVVCRESINELEYIKIKKFISSIGLVLIETSAEEHDRQIARSLTLTHLIGRTMIDMGLETQDISTIGYERLLRILETVQNDSWQLFLDMNKYNRFSKDIRTEFINSINKIEDKLR